MVMANNSYLLTGLLGPYLETESTHFCARKHGPHKKTGLRNLLYRPQVSKSNSTLVPSIYRIVFVIQSSAALCEQMNNQRCTIIVIN